MTGQLQQTTESGDEYDDEVDTSHLDGVEDGCGCAEVWEHLSEQRDASAD
jgi:hypothetical protein